ncbi:two-component system, OmpR family, copper resistance phosphate regulon response regulator CusR [Variovorax sp. OK605]|uniref:winged helix-turn-helix domain-containing protein n=1 Tax=Variovorax sp. OK605 TaxID=1855317 RepID=UPI0008EDA7E8|nr:response regulator transcription factor [Variovorax sp. OK605]SFP90058.1 two-component system, OmpR family, copper resistance phosphate regulon response regulator CusR [Variovorax sp. OK605]
MNVLLLGPGHGLRDTLGAMLARAGFAVDEADTRSAGAWLRAGKPYALVVLDAGQPEEIHAAVHAVIGAVRRCTAAPLLVLTQRDPLADRLEGLALGATEYLVKPCAPADLLARAWALASRGHEPEAGLLRLADLAVDRERGKAFRQGVDLGLSATLFELLDVLMAHKGQVLSRAELIRAVWGSNAQERDNMVTVGILRLRQKLDGPFALKLIHTVRGGGYVLALGP